MNLWCPKGHACLASTYDQPLRHCGTAIVRLSMQRVYRHVDVSNVDSKLLENRLVVMSRCSLFLPIAIYIVMCGSYKFKKILVYGDAYSYPIGVKFDFHLATFDSRYSSMYAFAASDASSYDKSTPCCGMLSAAACPASSA